MNETYKPYFRRELDLPERWYLNDAYVTDIYQKMDDYEISLQTAKSLYDELDVELQSLLSIPDDKRNQEELQRVHALNKIASELFLYIGRLELKRNEADATGLPDEEGVINLGDTIH